MPTRQDDSFPVVFSEVQSFRQKWLWILLGTTSLVIIFIFAHAWITQLVAGRPWGNHPMSDVALIFTGVFSLLASAGFLFLFYRISLVTEVRRDGIRIRFWPLAGRQIDFSSIRSCRPVTYRPIRDYGGWGIRYGRTGKAYTVSGHRGVELGIATGRPLLIGSQRPEELAAAIKAGLAAKHRGGRHCRDS